MSKIKDQIEEATILIFVGLMIFAPLGILGWQAYGYLRNGQWISLSVLDAFRWMDVKWAFAPTDWIGLYKLLESTPLSVGVFITFLLLFFSLKQD